MEQLTVTDVVSRSIGYAFNKGFWHSTLEQALDDLTPEQAAWKPAHDRTSIHDIVRHLSHWKAALLRDWDGVDRDQDPEAFGATFELYASQDWQPTPTSAETWQADVHELKRISATLLEKVESEGEAYLRGRAGTGARVWNIMNATTHDAYHTGQIMLLRKLQGL